MCCCYCYEFRCLNLFDYDELLSFHYELSFLKIPSSIFDCVTDFTLVVYNDIRGEGFTTLSNLDCYSLLLIYP